MADSLVGYVIEYLANDDDAIREIALAWLCEGYMNEPQIAQTVFKQWDSRSAENAFLTFPMQSYFPIANSQISEACDRAHALAIAGGELTSMTTRCAGKLLEHVTRLPAKQLQPHIEAITETAQSSKIFFRVDLEDLKSRIALLEKSADQLAQLLEEAVEVLSENPDHLAMNRQALRAIEALRLNHPNYLDLSAVLSQGSMGSGSSGQRASEASLRIVLASLAQFPSDDWLEQDLAPWLLDSRESILAASIEALVHRGSGLSAQVLVNQFDSASDSNRRWLARGLQRMRVHGLAPLISQIRDRVSEHALWMMLLVAELQQLDPASGPSIVDTIDDLESASQALIDAGTLYAFVCGPLQEQLQAGELETSFRALFERVHRNVNSESQPQRDLRSIRRSQSKQIDKLFNKRRK